MCLQNQLGGDPCENHTRKNIEAVENAIHEMIMKRIPKETRDRIQMRDAAGLPTGNLLSKVQSLPNIKTLQMQAQHLKEIAGGTYSKYEDMLSHGKYHDFLMLTDPEYLMVHGSVPQSQSEKDERMHSMRKMMETAFSKFNGDMETRRQLLGSATKNSYHILDEANDVLDEEFNRQVNWLRLKQICRSEPDYVDAQTQLFNDPKGYSFYEQLAEERMKARVKSFAQLRQDEIEANSIALSEDERVIARQQLQVAKRLRGAYREFCQLKAYGEDPEDFLRDGFREVEGYSMDYSIYTREEASEWLESMRDEGYFMELSLDDFAQQQRVHLHGSKETSSFLAHRKLRIKKVLDYENGRELERILQESVVLQYV